MRSQPITDRILGELEELEQIIARIQEGMHKLERTGDLLYLDSVALNLQGFYNGLENIFESIAQGIDQDLPQGQMWHRELLSQMTQELPGVRPAVISEETSEALDEYRAFRHIVRHVYSTRFDRERVEPLAESVSMHFRQLEREVRAFVAFLRASEPQA